MSRVSIKDVAKLANVSVATVSNVMNGTGRVSADTARRVKRVIEELRFSPSLAARNLKDKSSSLIAVVVPYLVEGSLQDNPFYWQLVRGIEESARDRKFQVILQGVTGQETFSFVHERHLDGMIVVGIYEASPLYRRILDLGVPCVFLDSYLSDSEVYEVSIEDEAGGYLGTKHLLELGHRRIALVTGGLKGGGVNDWRYKGYCRALEEAGLPFDPTLVHHGSPSLEGGYRIASGPLHADKSITAVFAFSDILAMGLMKGLLDSGRSVPKDISVMGFDDLFFSAYMSPSLTTIRQDITYKGKVAMELLLKQIAPDTEAPQRKIRLEVALQKRNSTAGYMPLDF